MQRYRKTSRLPNIVIFVFRLRFMSFSLLWVCDPLNWFNTTKVYIFFFLKQSNLDGLGEVYKFMRLRYTILSLYNVCRTQSVFCWQCDYNLMSFYLAFARDIACSILLNAWIILNACKTSSILRILHGWGIRPQQIRYYELKHLLPITTLPTTLNSVRIALWALYHKKKTAT